MSGEHELREVPLGSVGGVDKELQESAFTDAMAAVSGVGAPAALASAFYARAQYRLAREDRDAAYEALRAELQARYEADRRALDIEYRMLYAQMSGLDALDNLDGFGPHDDYNGGFGVE